MLYHMPLGLHLLHFSDIQWLLSTGPKHNILALKTSHSIHESLDTVSTKHADAYLASAGPIFGLSDADGWRRLWEHGEGDSHHRRCDPLPRLRYHDIIDSHVLLLLRACAPREPIQQWPAAGLLVKPPL